MQKRVHHSDQIFMRRAIQLAKNGAGSVSPNPLVGSVVVYQNQIIGEGWHKKYGGPHAEVMAISQVNDLKKIKGSTVYVNLEPCSHTGKTPPCADLLIKHQVGRVVLANVDPNPKVAGSGVARLEKAGIDVEVGVLADEAIKLNRRFFTFMDKKRPYVILKWAQTTDGFVAKENFDSRWISNVYSRQYVHKWRAEEDAILVGTQTAKYDNPQLNVRDWYGRNPVRVVVDRRLILSQDSKLFDGTQQTLCYNLLKDEDRYNLNYIKLGEKSFIQDLLVDLYQREIQSVFVEGGAKTLEAFIEAGMWDEARIFTASKKFGSGIKAPHLKGVVVAEQDVQGDQLCTIMNSSD